MTLFPFWELKKSPFDSSWIPFTQVCFVSSLIEIGHVVLEKFRQYIFVILLLYPLRKGRGPSFEQVWMPLTWECFVPSLIEIAPMVLDEKILNFVNWFLLFRYYLHLEKIVTLYLFMNSLHWPNGSEEEYKMWKVKTRTDRRRATGDHNSLLELSSKGS